MFKNKPVLLSLLLGLVFVLPAAANAAVIGFEAVGPDAQQVPALPYTEQGYTFVDSNPNGNSDGIFGTNVGNYDGSARLVFCSTDGSCGAGTYVTMTGPGSFSITSIDAGAYVANGGGGTLELLGSLAGGGTVSTVLNIGTAFATFSLSGFDDLTSLRLTGQTTYAVAVDNLVVGAANNVPEPATLGLMAISAIGLMASRRRSRNP